jgi:hypothetical protein
MEAKGLGEREPQPTEAQQGGWTYSHPHWSKCGFDDLVNSIVANAVAFYRDTRDAFRSDVIDARRRFLRSSASRPRRRSSSTPTTQRSTVSPQR